jgi:SAM-dependent methyltransferase
MASISNFIQLCKTHGLSRAVWRSATSVFRAKPKLLENFSNYTHFFADKSGLEIGGPSEIFKNKPPIYKLLKSLDGVNFSTNTVWEDIIRDGSTYRYFSEKSGIQYIREASLLTGISNEKYDFVLASHCLEHCANAIKTVKEWLRVLRPGGVLLLVLPNRHETFDHRRSVTKFAHLLADEQASVDESDLTHLEEILTLHDLSIDELAGSPEQFKSRSLNNLHNRCLHHHVFDIPLLEQIYRYLGVRVLNTDSRNVSQYIMGQKQ